MLYLIPAIIIIIALAAIFWIIARKYYCLAIIDTKSIASERENIIKDRIIADRIRRGAAAKLESINGIVIPILERIKNYFRRIYHKILELEKKYQLSGKIVKINDEMKEKLRMMHILANDFFIKEDFINAENKYIEILSLDRRNLDAYKGLAEIYLKQKNYQHAMEILLHAIKINSKDEHLYITLGILYKELGNMEEAKKYFLKTLALNKKNSSNYVNLYFIYKETDDFKKAIKVISKAAELIPSAKNLELLIEINILIKDKKMALVAYEQLKAISNEDNKLDEIKRKIDEIK